MTTTFIHERLANSASWFILILALWAVVQFIRNRPLDGAWMGAAVIAEGLLIFQALLGAWMFWGQGLSGGLERGWLHLTVRRPVRAMRPSPPAVHFASR